jgi:hypothetical protein
MATALHSLSEASGPSEQATGNRLRGTSASQMRWLSTTRPAVQPLPPSRGSAGVRLTLQRRLRPQRPARKLMQRRVGSRSRRSHRRIAVAPSLAVDPSRLPALDHAPQIVPDATKPMYAHPSAKVGPVTLVQSSRLHIERRRPKRMPCGGRPCRVDGPLCRPRSMQSQRPGRQRGQSGRRARARARCVGPVARGGR